METHELPPGQWGVTPETQHLLLHCRDPDRECKLFSCQREAVETLIWLTEVEPKAFRKQIEDAKAEANPGLQDGDRRREDDSDGDDHRLARGQSRAPAKLKAILRCVSRRYAGITIKDRLRVPIRRIRRISTSSLIWFRAI